MSLALIILINLQAIQQRKGTILQRCLACGHVGNIDMRHKVTTFILKNPPDQDINAMTPCKKEKKVAKKSSSGSAPSSKTPSKEVEVTTPTDSPEHDDYEDDWCDDTSAAAVAERQLGLSSAAKNLTINDDIDKSMSQRVNMFYVFVKVIRFSLINCI